MELDDIKRHALAARQFQVVHGNGTYTITVPTKLQTSIAYSTAFEQSDQMRGPSLILFQRELLLKAVTAWSGVQVKDVLPDYAGEDSFAFESEGVELLLNAKPELEAVLMAALMERVVLRGAIQDTAEKN